MWLLLNRIAAALLTIALPCLLGGCLEGYEEEMVIHSDLSGSATVKVALPDALLSGFDGVHAEFALDRIQKRFGAAKGVKLMGYTLTEGRFPEATFNVAFSSLDALGAAAAANPPAQILVGEFTVKPEAGGRTTIERRLGRGTATMSLPTDKFAIYKTHFRLPVELSNTDSGFKDTSRNDVRYRWSLADIGSQKPSMVNQVVKSWPWAWIFGGAAAVLFSGWVLWMGYGRPKVVYNAAPEGAEEWVEEEQEAERREEEPGGPEEPEIPGDGRR